MLSEPEKEELEKFINSNLFARAKKEVFRKTSFALSGSDQPNAALLLAQEKGVRQAFEALDELIKPSFVHTEPTVKTIHNRK